MVIHTVTIMHDDGEPMTAAFSSIDKANAFEEKIKAMLAEHGLDWWIVRDSDVLDGEQYIDWISDILPDT